MKFSIYDFREYKAYLKYAIRHSPQMGHGFRTQIARALNCQTAYVSQVLNQQAQFNLEQAEELNTLLKHTREEGHFFLILVQKARAGTTKLRQRFEEELQGILARREILKERVDKMGSLSHENQMRYYSRWYYAGIHMACMIPELQEKESCAKALRLPLNVVGEVLEFLESVGLIQRENGRFKSGVTRLFLGQDSPMIVQMHTNWRMRTIQSLENPNRTDLHYSTCASLSEHDRQKLKDKIIEFINEAHKTIETSPEEDLCHLSIDFYSLLGE